MRDAEDDGCSVEGHSGEEDPGEVDGLFVARTDSKAVVRVPGGRESPSWARKGAPNCRGRVDPGARHYLAVVAVGGAAVEGIVDTGACRTMMDITTAKALGLEVEERDPDGMRCPFGRFFGPDGQPRPYEGRVVGTVVFHFSNRVALRLPEVKLVRGEDPLLLLGTDLLGPRMQGWGFLHVGYHPFDGRGIIAFSR